jgi:hypothetical protein
MKLLYVSSHQIHNLTPLFRALTKRKEIKFKTIYWVNISTNVYDIKRNKDYKSIACNENVFKFRYDLTSVDKFNLDSVSY